MTNRKPTDVRRTEIADAALHVVATRGIAALSTRVLADAVGLTTGALFKHFPNRDAMLLGMAERVYELLQATYPDAVLPPRERLHQFAEARLTLVSGTAGVLTLVLSEQFALALPDDAVRVLRAAISQTHAFVAGAIRDGQADGSIRADVPAEALALLFMGALQMTALARRTRAVAGTPHAVEALDVLFRPSLTLEKP
jgi:AcrR family transcriptional regulator